MTLPPRNFLFLDPRARTYVPMLGVCVRTRAWGVRWCASRFAWLYMPGSLSEASSSQSGSPGGLLFALSLMGKMWWKWGCTAQIPFQQRTHWPCVGNVTYNILQLSALLCLAPEGTQGQSPHSSSVPLPRVPHIQGMFEAGDGVLAFSSHLRTALREHSGSWSPWGSGVCQRASIAAWLLPPPHPASTLPF